VLWFLVLMMRWRTTLTCLAAAAIAAVAQSGNNAAPVWYFCNSNMSLLTL
jgi:hypothetical protein